MSKNNNKIMKKKTNKMSIEERRFRNKISARKCRQKKIDYICELQQKVLDLQEENKILYDIIINS